MRTDILNNLIEKFNFNTYLEIGVRRPQTNFDKINCQHKIGVDPYPTFKEERPEQYKLTSDNFFKENTQTFDLIFIDGLHEAETCYRDIKNSIKILNEGGVILMHDCAPKKKEHTMDCNRTGGKPWNGTVFQAYIKAKYELKDYSVFVINEDEGCGLITKRPLLHNKYVSTDENISWEDYIENKVEILQLISSKDFYKLLEHAQS